MPPHELSGMARYCTLFRTDLWKVVPAQAIVAHLSITCARVRGGLAYCSNKAKLRRSGCVETGLQRQHTGYHRHRQISFAEATESHGVMTKLRIFIHASRLTGGVDCRGCRVREPTFKGTGSLTLYGEMAPPGWSNSCMSWGGKPPQSMTRKAGVALCACPLPILLGV